MNKYNSSQVKLAAMATAGKEIEVDHGAFSITLTQDVISSMLHEYAAHLLEQEKAQASKQDNLQRAADILTDFLTKTTRPMLPKGWSITPQVMLPAQKPTMILQTPTGDCWRFGASPISTDSEMLVRDFLEAMITDEPQPEGKQS